MSTPDDFAQDPQNPPPQGYGPPPSQPSPPEWGPRHDGDDTTWAVLVHLSFFVLGIIGPIVVMVTKGRESGWVREHAVEALNFHITVAIGTVVSALLILVLVGIVLLPAVLIAACVFTVLAAVAASRGERYRYPLTLRLVR